MRLVLATASSVTLVLGPGLAARAVLSRRGTRLPLALVGLPGPALLALSGGLAWGLAAVVPPQLSVALLLTPVVVAVGAVTALLPDAEPGTSDWGRRAILVMMVVLAVAVAKGTWSPGPAGELYGSTVSRTLEVGGRSDSPISFHVVQLVAHGTNPYSARGEGYFLPYSFAPRTAGGNGGQFGRAALRRPGAGRHAGPAVVALRCRGLRGVPPGHVDDGRRDPAGPVRPCDAGLGAPRRVPGHPRGGPDAIPAPRDLLHLAQAPRPPASCSWPRTWCWSAGPGWAGLATGVGYLVHPVALFSAPPLALLWILVGRDEDRPFEWRRVASGLGSMVGLVLVCLAAWRLLNGSHFAQQTFWTDNVTRATPRRSTGSPSWLGRGRPRC